MTTLMKRCALLLLAMFIVRPAGAEGESTFKYAALQVNAEGKSHFVSSESPMNSHSEAITEPRRTDPVPATKASFMRLLPGFESPWHNAPVPVYLLVLQGEMTVEVATGERRTFSKGDVILFGDTTGQGHRTTVGPEGVLFAMVETK